MKSSISEQLSSVGFNHALKFSFQAAFVHFQPGASIVSVVFATHHNFIPKFEFWFVFKRDIRSGTATIVTPRCLKICDPHSDTAGRILALTKFQTPSIKVDRIKLVVRNRLAFRTFFTISKGFKPDPFHKHRF